MSSGQSTKERRTCQVQHCTRPQDSAKYAVKHVFEILGVDIDDPQQVKSFQESLRFSESLLALSRKGVVATMVSVITLLTTAAGTIIWSALTKGQ